MIILSSKPLLEEVYKFRNLFEKIDGEVKLIPIFELPSYQTCFLNEQEAFESLVRKTEQLYYCQTDEQKIINQEILFCREINSETIKIISLIGVNIELVEEISDLSTEIYSVIRNPVLRNPELIKSLKTRISSVAKIPGLYQSNVNALKRLGAIADQVALLPNSVIEPLKIMQTIQPAFKENQQAACFFHQFNWLQKTLSKSNQKDIYNKLKILKEDMELYFKSLSEYSKDFAKSLKTARRTLLGTIEMAEKLMESLAIGAYV